MTGAVAIDVANLTSLLTTTRRRPALRVRLPKLRRSRRKSNESRTHAGIFGVPRNRAAVNRFKRIR